MAVEKIQYTDTLRQGADKINAAIDQSNEAIEIANQALTTANDVQTQLDTIVIEGDSSVEAAQARVDAEGYVFTTLKERLDTKETQFSQGIEILQTNFEQYTAQPIYNVKGFGAVGDGVTDDTVAIQAVINMAPAGSVVVIPEGTYLVTSTVIANKEKQTILGPGKLQLGMNDAYAISVQADDVIIDGLCVINPNGFTTTGTSGSGGIQINGHRVSVRNCRIDGCVNGIIVETNYKGAQIIGNVVTNTLGVASESQGDGIAVFGPNGVIVGNFVSCKTGTDGRCGIVLDLAGSYGTIAGNTVEGPFRRSIHVELSPYSAVIGNTLRGATNWGIVVVDTGVSVADNVVETPQSEPGPLPDQPLTGIYVYSGQNISVSGNIIRSGGVGNGIHVLGGDNITISENQIVGDSESLAIGIYLQAKRSVIKGNSITPSVCSIYGIQVDNTSDCIVEGNQVEKTGSHGIFLSFSPTNCIVRGNLVRNCAGEGIRVSGGEYHIIEGNRCYDDQPIKTQTFGIVNFAANNVSIVNNTVFGNRDGGIAPATGGATGVFASGNMGYNPVGLLSPPGIPASGTPQINTFPVRVRIFVSGGTVSAIAINGTNTGLTAGSFELDPGETITLTYTAPPSWQWFGL